MHANLKPRGSVPPDTLLAASQIYNLQNIYLRIGDQFDSIFAETDLTIFDPSARESVETIAQLSLVTAFQYAELIPDSVASDASRKRLDWKYALHLPVQHRGITSSALCSFRQGLFLSTVALQEYDRFLEILNKVGLYGQTDHCLVTSGTVLATICNMTRLHQLYSGMKSALAALATTESCWLLEMMPAHWYARYKTGPLSLQQSLNWENTEEKAIRIGIDIHFLCSALNEYNKLQATELAEIQQLAHLLNEQFFFTNDQIHWRKHSCKSCASNFRG